MKQDSKKSKSWLKEITVSLPHIDQILARVSTDILVIGAGVFGLYEAQNWIQPLKRRTGDLDLSIGLVHGKKDYDRIKEDLLRNKYTQRSREPGYRYFSPVLIPNHPSYIDLLAHPNSKKISKSEAARVMGAGSEFSFDAMDFALQECFEIIPKIHYPNPIGFMALKRTSYLDDPTRRIKDLADILELTYGLVQKGKHFDLSDLWKKLCLSTDAKNVQLMLRELGSQESAKWDIQDARQELLSRSFSIQEIDETIPSSLLDFVANLIKE